MSGNETDSDGDGLDFVLTPLLDEAERQMRKIRRPLDAELWASELLGMLELGTPDDAPVTERERRALDLAIRLVRYAEEAASPTGLAMLRTLSVIGPEESRALAGQAAARLTETGIRDKAWAAALGRPAVAQCWQFADPAGRQQSVSVIFALGQDRHVLTVLIDHEHGGGVQDCWIGEDPDAVLAETRGALADQHIELQSITAGQARDLLQSAIARPECPAEPDEIEDVALGRALLRSRIALLADEMPPAPPKQKQRRAPVRRQVLRLKVSLPGSKPPIWRRLEVPSDLTLGQLHQVIQVAFGWTDSHLHVFETEQGSFGVPEPELEFADEDRARLSQLAPVGAKFVYSYDFGDGWTHLVQVEQISPVEPGVVYPRCTGGRRAGPLEDSGGIGGYQEIIVALADPAHPDHQHYQDWLAEVFGLKGLDPAALDLDQVNAELAALPIGKRRSGSVH